MATFIKSGVARERRRMRKLTALPELMRAIRAIDTTRLRSAQSRLRSRRIDAGDPHALLTRAFTADNRHRAPRHTKGLRKNGDQFLVRRAFNRSRVQPHEQR